MPYNGLGSFTQLYNWVSDAAAGLLIRSDRMQAEAADIASGLSNAICKDGQTVITANLPMSGFRHLNCADAVNIQEYATLNQLNNMSSAGGAYVVSNISSSGAAQALDLATYQAYFITLTAACTITITGNPTSGANLNERLIVLLQNNSGGYAVTFPASIKWTGTASPSTAPTLGTSANTYALIRIKTIDSGVTWIGSVEGSGGQGGGNLPIAGIYLAVGQANKANSSSDGANFSVSSPVFAGGSLDIIDVIYSTLYSKFILLGNPSGNDSPANSILTTAAGASYSAPSGAATVIPANTNNRLYQFSNGNIITTNRGTGSGQIAFSSDGGVTFSGKTANAATAATRWVGAANTAMMTESGSGIFTYTTDGGVNYVDATHTGVTNATANAYANGNYIVGGASGNLGYKTLVSATALTTITSNLASANFLGGMWTGSTYIVWTAASLSTAITIAGTYTSRTTAFFTTAGMGGNIVAIITNVAQTVVMAVTDTGDVGRSIDFGVTWSKLSVGNNPLAGNQIYGIKFVDGNFWIFGNTGKIAYSVDGVTFTNAPTTSFGSNAILSFAGA